MGTFSIWHWLIVLVIVVLVFGTGKLKNLGRDLGSGIKGFKEGLNEGQADTSKQVANDANKAIDVNAKDKEASK